MYTGTARIDKSVPLVIGTTIGAVTVSTVGYRDEPLWPVWGSLVIALTMTSGVVFTYGITRWRGLAETERTHGRQYATMFTVSSGSWILILAAQYFVQHEELSPSEVLISTCLMGMVPASCTMLAVRRAGRRREVTVDGELADWLIHNRRLLRDLLAAQLALVTITTLALGVTVRLQHDLVSAHRLDAEHALQPGIWLISGFSFSLIIGLVYLPAVGELRRRARELCARLSDLTQATDGPTLLSRIEDRTKLESLLGADTAPLMDLKSMLVVTAPVLLNAAASLLSL